MKQTLALLTGLLLLASAPTSLAVITAAWTFSETITHSYGNPPTSTDIFVRDDLALAVNPDPIVTDLSTPQDFDLSLSLSGDSRFYVTPHGLGPQIVFDLAFSATGSAGPVTAVDFLTASFTGNTTGVVPGLTGAILYDNGLSFIVRIFTPAVITEAFDFDGVTFSGTTTTLFGLGEKTYSYVPSVSQARFLYIDLAGTIPDPGPFVTVVPEPSRTLLSLLGLCVVLARRRR